MNLGVAVYAAAIQDPRVGARTAGEIAPDQKVVDVAKASDLAMTSIAQKRYGSDQQRLVVGTVRVVAAEATLDDWRVFPDERPALLGVAARAQDIDTIGSQQRIGRRTVRLVAIATGDLALENGHVGALAELAALRWMTPEADLGDGPLGKQAQR